MPRIFKIPQVELQTKESPLPAFAWKTSARLANLVGAKHLQFDIRSLDPGKFSFPYHFHRNAEELFLILSGKATLRSPDGYKELEEGDLVFFEMEASGAHQMYNHTDSPCLYLDIRTTVGIDVCEYPDSNKVNILPYMEVYEKASRADYYRGEEDVESRWPEEIVKKKAGPADRE